MPLRSRSIVSLAAVAATFALLPATASAATISSSTANPLLDGFANDAECSLREMVAIANDDNAAIEPDCTVDTMSAALGDDTINLGTGTYQLSIAPGAPSVSNGDLDVDDTIPGNQRLTIIGNGRANTRIDGGDLDRVFTASEGDFRLDLLTVQNGQVTSNNAGGILSTANLNLESAVVTGNTTVTAGAGGGIAMAGTAQLTLSNSSVDSNIAAGTGGGIELRQGASLVTQGSATVGGDTPAEGNTAGNQGGGINFSSGPVNTDGDIELNPGASVENNSAVGFGGGIAHNVGTANSDLILSGAGVKNNHVTGANIGGGGGGIHYVSGSPTQTFSISNGSSIDGNTVTGEEATGAGINAATNLAGFSITQSSVSNNTTTVGDDADLPSPEGGGGITLTGSSASTVTETTIRDNEVDLQDPDDAAVGGGILDNGRLTLDRSLVAGNTVDGGAKDTNVNFTPQGAGVYAGSPLGATNVINSTFASNTAVAGTQGSVGGGIVGVISSHPLTIAHTTFLGNSAFFGDAINIGGAPLPSTDFTLRGSLIDEGANGCFPALLMEDSNAFNVDAGTSCVGSNVDTDLRNGAPLMVDGITPQGGFTETADLLAGSPAIDFVPNVAPHCRDLTGAPLTVDQRGVGFPRPEGAACDAGAFEAQDADNDGVVDVNDACPAQVGPVSNGGCPVSDTPITPITPVTPTATLGSSTAVPTAKRCKKKRSAAAAKKCKRKK